MLRFRKLSIAVAVAATACLGLLPSAASAASPSQYPDQSDVSLSLNVKHCYIGGTPIIAHARATAGNLPLQGTMTITIADKTSTKHSTDLTATYPTNKVTKKTQVKVTATFVPDPEAKTPPVSAPLSSGAVQVIPASFTTSAMATALRSDPTSISKTVTLAPARPGCTSGNGNGNGNGNNGSGVLPNTGGTNAWYIILGAALLTMGVGITVMARGRRSIHRSL